MDSVIIFLARDLFVAVILVWLVTLFMIGRSKRLAFVVSLVIAGILALIFSKIADSLYYHPRPFVSNPAISPLFAHGSDNGFPSEHTVFTMTLTSVIYFYRRPLGLIALGLTLLVGAGRVWAHVHSWVDILGGLAIGAIAGYAGVMLAKLLVSRFISKQPVDRH